MNRIPTAREIGEFGPACQNAVRAQVNVVSSVFVIQNFAIAGHQHGNGIGKQKHACSNRAREPVQSFITNPNIFQVHCVHQVMQGHVGISSAKPRQQWRHKSAESNQRIAPKCAEQQIKPNHIRFHAMQRLHQAHDTSRVIEGPATYDRKSFRLDVPLRELVCQHDKTEKRIALQFLRNVESIFAQSASAWRKGRN